MEKFYKGAKRKCTKCSTLFFDFEKYPIVCPNCGADVTTLLTNVSRRGRPPKISKSENNQETKDMEIQDIEVEDSTNAEEVDSEEENVDDIVEIDRDTNS